MSKSLNVVALTGKLVAEPELRYFGSGMALLNLRLCFWTNKKEGESWVETGNFIDVKQFKPSEKFVGLLHKGSPLAISGRLEVEEWKDKETGKSRSKVVVVAQEITFAGPKQSNETPKDHDTLAPIDGQKTIPLDEGEWQPF